METINETAQHSKTKKHDRAKNNSANNSASLSPEQARKRYRTEIPNIVFHLGLKPRELCLYAYIRRVAGEWDKFGERGKCWQSTETLANACNMSVGSVSTSKPALLISRPELGGKSLLKHLGKKSDCDCYEVVDIWDDNLERFKPVQNMNADPSTIERDRSYIETKKEPLKKEQKEEFLREKNFFQAEENYMKNSADVAAATPEKSTSVNIVPPRILTGDSPFESPQTGKEKYENIVPVALAVADDPQNETIDYVVAAAAADMSVEEFKRLYGGVQRANAKQNCWANVA